MKVLADASLPGLEQAFPAPFELTTYTDRLDLEDKLAWQDLLLCRSTLKVNAELLDGCHLQYVATASSGIDHVDEAYLKNRGIELVSAKGSNAVAVADYVVSCLAWLDKNKLLKGQQAAVVGLGEVGGRVSERLKACGYHVLHYDPLKASLETDFESCSIDDLYRCDLICLHAQLHDRPPFASRNIFDKKLLAKLNEQTVIINASRGGIVNEEALLKAEKSFVYCVDVFSHEPDISREIVDYASLCTPHIAGHSLEAKFEAVNQISRYFHDLKGLNYPDFACPELINFEPDNNCASWQDWVLSLYNPSIETHALKQAGDLKECFLKLRKKHQFRHDFSVYPLGIDDDLLLRVLGS